MITMKDVFKWSGYLINKELMKYFNFNTDEKFNKEKIIENAKFRLSLYDESKYPGKSKHDEYIISPKWKTRRMAFLKANLWAGGCISCEICGLYTNDINEKIAWNIHHNSYHNFAHKQFYVELEDLCTLCPDCHESLHTVIDSLLHGTDRTLYKEYKNNNGKFLDPDGCFRFGKYEGQYVGEVPQSYLSWVRNETNSEYDIDLIDHH